MSDRRAYFRKLCMELVDRDGHKYRDQWCWASPHFVINYYPSSGEIAVTDVGYIPLVFETLDHRRTIFADMFPSMKYELDGYIQVLERLLPLQAIQFAVEEA